MCLGFLSVSHAVVGLRYPSASGSAVGAFVQDLDCKDTEGGGNECVTD